MEIRIRETGAVVTENEFRTMHPNTSGPIAAMMEQFDADPVLEAPAPTVQWNQTAQRKIGVDAAVWNGLNNWVQAWQVIDWSQEQIDTTVAQARLAKNTEIDRAREQANNTTFVHQGLMIACDALSFKDIASTASHIALFGTFPPEFPGGWKGKDAQGNTAYVLMPTLDDFKAFYSSMTAQGTANFNKSQGLKIQLAAATTLPEIQAIVW